MLKKNVTLILLLSSIVIVGCSSAILKTSEPAKNISSDSDDQYRVGSVYYLPKALIPISIKAIDTSGSGGGGNSSSNNSSAQVTNNIIVNGRNIKNEPEIKPDKNTNQDKIKKFEYTVRLGDLKYIPDTNHAYFLEHNENVLFDDNITIEVGENQLLTSAQAVAKDQTGEVLIKLADLAGTIAKMTTGVPSAPKSQMWSAPIDRNKVMADKGPIYICVLPDIKNIDTILDPTNLAAPDDTTINFSISKLNTSLAEAHLPIQIKASPLVKLENKPQSYPALKDNGFEIGEFFNWDGCYKSNSCISKGVLVRSPIPYFITVDVTKNTGDSRFYRIASDDEIKNKTIQKFIDPQECLNQFEVKETRQTFLAMAPNDGPITNVDVSRASFVTKTTKLSIVNGMLRKIEMEKPSQLMGFIKIPVDMAKAVAEIPGSILSFQIKNTQDEASFYKAQTDLLTQMQALKDKQDSKNSTSQ